MSENPINDPNFRAFADRVIDELVPKLERVKVFVTVADNIGKSDISYAVQLGLAIMMDKPIVLVVPAGVEPPRHLRKVADATVAMDPDKPEQLNQLEFAKALNAIGIITDEEYASAAGETDLLDEGE